MFSKNQSNFQHLLIDYLKSTFVNITPTNRQLYRQLTVNQSKMMYGKVIKTQ